MRDARRIESLAGCITSEARAEETSPLDPLDLKTDWTSDLPRLTTRPDGASLKSLQP